MRWIVFAVLTGLLVGFGCGFGLSPKTIVVRGELAAAPLAPHMSLSRFLRCSEAQSDELSEAQWDALNAR